MAGGLTQVLYDGTNTYLYGVDRISQHHDTTSEYYLADALGSVRQLTNSTGNVVLARAYDPYGGLVENNAYDGVTTAYGFAGGFTDTSGMVYLRARYYSPAQGRFVSRDVWEGDYNNPLSLNRWGYVEGNPINYVDPVGLYSSSPIHAMIQAHFEGTYGLGHIIVPEFFIPGGSKTGLSIGIPTGGPGFIDIVDITTREAYEIKHENQIMDGINEINWYISKYNSNPRPIGPNHLVLGTNYKWAWEGWVVIGTNPHYAGQVILARMITSGIITYKGVSKTKIPVPLPKYVWEWDPNNRKVEKREQIKIPNWLPNTAPTYSNINIIDLCKVGVVVIATTIAFLTPYPDELILPNIFQSVPAFP